MTKIWKTSIMSRIEHLCAPFQVEASQPIHNKSSKHFHPNPNYLDLGKGLVYTSHFLMVNILTWVTIIDPMLSNII